MNIKSPVILDVAYNNEGIDWPNTSGIDGVICKATERLGRDPELANNWTGLARRGIPRGAYHFYRPTAGSADQAQFFVQALRDNGGIRAGDVLVLDAEADGMSLASLVDFIYNVEVLTGIRPLLYSRANILNALSVTNLSVGQRDYLRQVKVWTAGYPINPDDYDTPPGAYIPDPARYGPVVLWQYAAEVPNVSNIPGGSDLNWVDPSFYDWWKAATPGGIPPMSFNYKVTPAGLYSLNVRQDHSVYSAIVGKLGAGRFAYGNTIWQANGETWLNVAEVDGQVMNGWVAVVYNGTTLGTLTELTPPPPPPPPPAEVYAAVVELTVEQPDGTVEVYVPSAGNPVDLVKK